MTAKKGDTVFVHYTGTLEDGTEFDSSRDREPLEFVLGSGMLIPGFDAAVMDKKVGDTVSVKISPKDAYGEIDPDQVIVVPRAEVPKEIDPVAGMLVTLSTEEGNIDVAISRVTDEEVELDANHPLAGKTLSFDIEVMKIVPN